MYMCPFLNCGVWGFWGSEAYWVECCWSVAKSCPTLWPCGLHCQAFPVFHHLPEFAQTHVHWVSYSLLSLILLPSVFPSIRVFSNESTLCVRWPEFWSFSFSISPSSECSGLISFRIDSDLLAVQGTLKSSVALQFESTNSSVFSLLCGPTLTSIYDCWKNHSFDYMDLCWQSDVSAF